MAIEKDNGRGREAAERRKPLRVAVSEVDQEILRLLVRRHNLLDKMRKNGRLEPFDEKYLREAWQNDVARVSHDAELSGRFFALMQKVSFLPKPAENDEAEARKRAAFNLAPPALPVKINMAAPLSGFFTRSFIYMAACAGQKTRLANCLQNDPVVDCIRGLAQMGGAISREDDAIICRGGAPLQAPDKVIHTGASDFNFYLFAAHYAGRPGRVKFTGSKEMQLADFSALRNIMPQLGCRMVHIVPKSNGLPARLECSGILPPQISISEEFPYLFAVALILAAPFYAQPFALNLARHPRKATILALAMPVLKKCGAVFSLQGDTISISPSALSIPGEPKAPVEAELAAFLQALPAALGGEASLEGFWPDTPEANAIWQICAQIGCERENNLLLANFKQPLQDFKPNLSKSAALPAWGCAFLACLAACAILRGGQAELPENLLDNADMADFFSIAGIGIAENGKLFKAEKRAGLAWNAPGAAWAMALAVAACVRGEKSGWPLGNPGIVTDLWPQFWSLYNSLPNPQAKKKEEEAAQPAPKPRRRIHTSAVAVLPEIKEEDW